jgi:hypothetical protein
MNWGGTRMEVIDYNGDGRWTRDAVERRYLQYAHELHCDPRDVSADIHAQNGRQWIYPIMFKIIDGIGGGDAACVRIGIEFIHEDRTFPFGRIIKDRTARALRHADLTAQQQEQLLRRVFAMLRAAKVPREFKEYARLVRKIGFTPADIPDLANAKPYVSRWIQYFHQSARRG